MFGKNRWALAATFACLLCTILSLPVYADSATGLQWLSSTAQQDGSLNGSSTISTPFQATAESLRTFSAAAVSGAQVSAAQSYLKTQNYFNTENLARLIIAGTAAGQDVSGAVTSLLANQDASTGGFGELPGYGPSVLDTAFALEALSVAGNTSAPAIAAAISFLQLRQNADGAWLDGDNGPSVYLAALCVASLYRYSSNYNVAQTIQNGATFLYSTRLSNGLWAEDFLSAESLIALLLSQTDLTAVQNSVQALQARQQANGSWGDDVYATALALRALAVSQLRNGSGTPSAGSGAVQGYVKLAGSSQPLTGATVSVPSIAGLSVQTNAAGYYILSGLQPGNITVVASKLGYGTASTVVQVVSGQTASASDLVLSQSAQATAVKVHLFDAGSGVAVGAAQVALSGAGTYSASTDNNGNVEFNGITPGSYSIAIQASGYPALQGTFSLNGGQALNLNQPLSKSAASGSSPVNVSATIVDGSTAAVIAGATLNFGGSLSASSDTSGHLVIGSVPPGSYTATLSASGYATQNYSLVVTTGANGNLGQLKLYSSNGSTAATTVTLVGTVLDGLSNKPVSDATVSIENSLLSAVSDASGHFTLSGITALSFTVAISATSYSAQTYTATASAYGSVAATFLLAPQAGAAGTTTLQGTITDSSTHAAISGATLAVGGSSITAQSDSAGHYSLTNLPSTKFSLQLTALNYSSQTLNINLTTAGTYNLDVTLNPSSQASSFQILSLSTNDSGKGANQVQIFTAQIGNQSSTSQEGILVGHILDSTGKEVAKVGPWAAGTHTPQSDFNFAPQEVKTLQLPWNPAQLSPGAYTLRLDVVKPGTISQGTPNGTVLAELSAFTSVSATQSFIGTLAFNPPAAQAGSSAPVTLEVLVVNSGNVPLTRTPLTLNIMAATCSPPSPPRTTPCSPTMAMAWAAPPSPALACWPRPAPSRAPACSRNCCASR